MEGKIVYFDQPGADNTEEVLRIAKKRAAELGIKTIVVATTFGDTAARATVVFKGLKVVAVTHSAGFKVPNVPEVTEENRKKITKNGGLILTTTHLFSGVGAAWRKKFNTYLLGDIIANTLRIVGQGMKVVTEISVMAADAGLVRTDEDIIAIAGTGRGADYAVVLRPVNSGDFFDLRIKEILCKPHF
ncbi:MAG: pyruvate kinase alpha/beta domain-containing protein [Dehalococcoidales bacterium]|nr:pyruvate kinase alpha/beta domain-containing protein [Dehalococcoidales bacterium]